MDHPNKDDRGDDGLESDHDAGSEDGIDGPKHEGDDGDVEDESGDVGTDEESELLTVGHVTSPSRCPGFRSFHSRRR